jgi:putative transposase
MVATPEDYPWSSYRFHAFGIDDGLLSPHSEYMALGATAAERRCAYRLLFANLLEPKTLNEIRDSVNRGWPLARERFIDEIEAALGRAARPPKRGRPARLG